MKYPPFLTKDTVTGFLLTGIGERNIRGETNYLIVDESKMRVMQKQPSKV